MKRIVASWSCCLALGVCGAGAWATEEPAATTDAALAKIATTAEVPGLPRVLLVGDSISGGYTPPVRERLAGKANVIRVGYNGGPTTKGLSLLKQSLGQDRWDVIHFNWGLHDLAYVGPDGSRVADTRAPGARHQVPLDAYEQNLRTLVAQLKETGARLIWCTTTPVPEGAKGRTPGDEVLYNAAAERVMRDEGIAINDLHSHAKARQADIQLRADVHFTAAGSEYLADKVAAEIEAHLPGKGTSAEAVGDPRRER